MRSLQMPQRCLWEALWRFLYQDLVRSTPAAAGPFFERSCDILLGWHEGLAQSLLQLLVRRSCGDPAETLSEAFAWSCAGSCETLLKRSWWNPGVLTWSGPGPCEKILWRSCWNPPQEVLEVRSWRPFVLLVLVCKFFWDAHRNFLDEDLVSSSL